MNFMLVFPIEKSQRMVLPLCIEAPRVEALQASPFVVTSSCHCGVRQYDELVISANANVVYVTLAQNIHIECHEM